MKKDIELWCYNQETWEKFAITLEDFCKAINDNNWSKDNRVYVEKSQRNTSHSMERNQYLREHSISSLIQKGLVK